MKQQDSEDRAYQQARAQMDSIRELVKALNDAHEGRDSSIPKIDAACDAITEDALQVSVRSGWVAGKEDMEPEEFMILLCTGGPAVRIIGDLNYGAPVRPSLQYQDWFEPWKEFTDLTPEDEDALLTYCQQFYFGE